MVGAQTRSVITKASLSSRGPFMGCRHSVHSASSPFSVYLGGNVAAYFIFEPSATSFSGMRITGIPSGPVAASSIPCDSTPMSLAG